MGVLVFVEDPGDELSQQALTFAAGPVASGDQAATVEAVSITGAYSPAAWGQTLASLVTERGARALVAPGTDRGNEVLAHAAAILDLPLSANTVSVGADASPTSGGDAAPDADAAPGGDAAMLVTRVRWGGSLLEQALLHGSPLLLTVAPHAVAADPTVTGDVTVETVQPAEHPLAVGVTERIGASTGGVSLSDAEVVVSGGRGVGSAEGFAVIEELAGLLGGAVGCSRAVTSAGWRPHTDQVGQTGTKIAPEIYIACGISGATQHMAGCRGAKRLLAINADGDASIFAHADYGVIGDLHEVLPAISAEIRRARGS